MRLTDTEEQRVEAALGKLPHTFVPLEGDTVPLDAHHFITNGIDWERRRSAALLFTDEGVILHWLSQDELLFMKTTGKPPDYSPILAYLDERGREWLDWWIHELS